MIGKTILSNAYTGAIAQLGERLLCTQEVCGSIPHSSTIKTQRVLNHVLNKTLKQGIIQDHHLKHLSFKRSLTMWIDENKFL
jgi:hypothetical protein